MKFLKEEKGILNVIVKTYKIEENIIFKTTDLFSNIGFVINTITEKKEIKTSRDNIENIIKKIK